MATARRRVSGEQLVAVAAVCPLASLQPTASCDGEASREMAAAAAAAAAKGLCPHLPSPCWLALALVLLGCIVLWCSDTSWGCSDGGDPAFSVCLRLRTRPLCLCPQAASQGQHLSRLIADRLCVLSQWVHATSAQGVSHQHKVCMCVTSSTDGSCCCTCVCCHLVQPSWRRTQLREECGHSSAPHHCCPATGQVTAAAGGLTSGPPPVGCLVLLPDQQHSCVGQSV